MSHTPGRCVKVHLECVMVHVCCDRPDSRGGSVCLKIPRWRVRRAHRGRVGLVSRARPAHSPGATHFASSAEHAVPARRLVMTDPPTATHTLMRDRLRAVIKMTCSYLIMLLHVALGDAKIGTRGVAANPWPVLSCACRWRNPHDPTCAAYLHKPSTCASRWNDRHILPQAISLSCKKMLRMSLGKQSA
jgi:hypothetical protein